MLARCVGTWLDWDMVDTRLDRLRLISPGLDCEGSLALDGGRIAAVLPAGTELPEAREVIDGRNRWMVPGFIDIHSHGANGHDSCEGSVMAIRAIAEAKVREGVTTWLPTTLSLPAEQLKATFRAVSAYREDAGWADVPGLHLEGPYLNPAAAGAQNPAFVRPPDLDEVDRLRAIAPLLIASIAPEVPGGLALCSALHERGVVVSAAHTCARCADILTARKQGLRHLTHFGNQMTPLHHRELGVVGAGLLDDELMLELIADGIHLSGDMIRLVWKLVPVERLMLVTDSISASWLPDGSLTQLGGLPVTIRDAAARLASGALAGSTARYFELFAQVLGITGMAPERVVAATAANQARSLGLADRGRLEPGLRADLALLDPDSFRPEAVWVAGTRRL